LLVALLTLAVSLPNAECKYVEMILSAASAVFFPKWPVETKRSSSSSTCGVVDTVRVAVGYWFGCRAMG
jgi:hypothetical protein